MSSQPGETITEPAPEAAAAEPARERRARHARRSGMYVSAVLFIAVLVAVIVLSAANARTVKVDWIAGSDSTSLVWIVVGATVVGWVLGISTCLLFRFRTRRRPAH